MTSSTDTRDRLTVAVIGSGSIGATIARNVAAAGWSVLVSNSRGPQSLAGLVEEMGPTARAATPAEAAGAADLVVASIPFGAHRSLPAQQLVGKVLIDTMNYYTGRDADEAELDDQSLTSSELLQRHLPGVEVVKAFNNVDYLRLARLPRPAGAPDRAWLPIAANSQDAVNMALRLLDAVGYEGVQVGSLADSWRQEPGSPVYVAPYSQDDPTITDPWERYSTAASVALPRQQVLDLTAGAVRIAPQAFPG